MVIICVQLNGLANFSIVPSYGLYCVLSGGLVSVLAGSARLSRATFHRLFFIKILRRNLASEVVAKPSDPPFLHKALLIKTCFLRADQEAAFFEPAKCRRNAAFGHADVDVYDNSAVSHETAGSRAKRDLAIVAPVISLDHIEQNLDPRTG